MSKGQTLRALVNERLTAAAEDIFALFERTIAEYEEELCRSKEENERKQQLLDSVLLSPRAEPHKQDAQVQTQSPCQDQGTPDSPQIKENSEIRSFKMETELLEDFSCAIKTECEEQTDDDEDWETPAGSSTQQMKTDGDDYNNQDYTEDSDRILFSQFNFEDISTNQTSTQSNTAENNNSCVREEGNEIQKIHECYFCEKKFRDKHNLKRHIVVHTGEKPFQCPVCAKCYSQKETLRLHMALHSRSKKSEEGQQAKQGCSSLTTKTLQPSTSSQRSTASPTKNSPFSCPVCMKCFTRTFTLQSHMITHTGEKPFFCLQCNMRFNRKSNLNRHFKVHAQKLKKYKFCDE